MRHSLIRVLGVAALACGACGSEVSEGVDPVEVSPSDGATEDAARPPDAGAAAAGAGAIWVEDAAGVAAGVLVRRGSDDNIASRAIYDLVTVYHPDSGLFYEVTMTDGVVRYPATTMFRGYGCDVPIGVAVGACTDCRSGFGVGLRHGDAWWRVRGGVGYEQLAPGSTRSSGLSAECVTHGTSNAKAYPVDRVTGATPPQSLSPPLRFVWR
ncbi:MAG: hypothetical protein CSA66_06995 [Proteobacteria bacterium]|nr:MAG: hypothetical protein CSA66_06995 [Pseudomonadota bacterium]